MKCPKCGSATWTDLLKARDGFGRDRSIPVHKCFCGWCSRPDVKTQQLGPKFLDKVVVK